MKLKLKRNPSVTNQAWTSLRGRNCLILVINVREKSYYSQIIKEMREERE